VQMRIRLNRRDAEKAEKEERILTQRLQGTMTQR
jgi:hypothetical protein